MRICHCGRRFEPTGRALEACEVSSDPALPTLMIGWTIPTECSACDAIRLDARRVAWRQREVACIRAAVVRKE